MNIMTFRGSEPPLSEQDIDMIETALGLRLPAALRNLYLSVNGGVPQPYVFEDANVDTVVSEFLPLRSETKGTAVDAYARLVQTKQLVPRNFFPFAVEGGGDYFFVDVSDPQAHVYFYRGDSAAGINLVNLHLSIDEFWSKLKEESSL